MMLSLVFAVLVADADPALELIPPAAVAAKASPWAASHGVLVAAKVGVFAGSGPAPVMASFSAELGWAAPWLSRLFGLSLEPGFAYSQLTRTTVVGRVQQRNLGFSMPVLLSANREMGPGLGRVLVGPVLYVFDGRSRGTPGFDTTGFDTTQVAIGADAGVSYLLWLGPGGLGLDLRYRAVPQTDINRTVLGHGLVAHLTYLLAL